MRHSDPLSPSPLSPPGQSFNKVFVDLRKPFDERMHYGLVWKKNNIHKHNWTKADLEVAFANPSWHRAVFVREPIDRFLSAFASKCRRPRDGGHMDARKTCDNAFPGVRWPPTLANVIRMLGTAQQGFDPHFMPQSMFCGGINRTLAKYQTVRVSARPRRSPVCTGRAWRRHGTLTDLPLSAARF